MSADVHNTTLHTQTCCQIDFSTSAMTPQWPHIQHLWFTT